jgi:hypothetical protein
VLIEPGKDPVPLVATTEDTFAPVTAVGKEEIAFVIGTSVSQTIAVATLANGRITRRIAVGKGAIDALAASPDGSMLYCAAQGTIWAVPVNGGEPKSIHAGDAVAADPVGHELVIRLNEKNRVRLVKVPVEGGKEQEIPFEGTLRIAGSDDSDAFISGAVGKDQRILSVANLIDSWYYRPALIDPRSKRISRIPVDYHGDFDGVAWAPDGTVIAVAAQVHGTIWRFRPESRQ